MYTIEKRVIIEEEKRSTVKEVATGLGGYKEVFDTFIKLAKSDEVGEFILSDVESFKSLQVDLYTRIKPDKIESQIKDWFIDLGTYPLMKMSCNYCGSGVSVYLSREGGYYECDECDYSEYGLGGLKNVI